MTPVEEGKISCGSMSNCAATNSTISFAFCDPILPVATLAFLLLITNHCNCPSATWLLPIGMGAPQNLLCVKTAAALARTDE